MPLTWLTAPDTDAWPTTPIDVPGTCCHLSLPAGWTPDDAPAEVDGESSFAYRGPSPVEWLTVRYRETEAAGELANWIGVVLRSIGFPVIPPGRVLIDLPTLDEWTGGEVDEEDLARWGVDELRAQQGSATWRGDPDGPRRLRLYTVLAKRGRQSWLIALSIETATVPGMPFDEIAGNDHARAAAVLSGMVLEPPEGPPGP